MEPLEGPPVSSPDPAIISSVEQQASSSTHAVSDMLASSPSVMTHTPHGLSKRLCVTRPPGPGCVGATGVCRARLILPHTH